MPSASPPKVWKLDGRNRIVVPPVALAALGASPRDYLTWEVAGSTVRLRRVPVGTPK